MNNLELEPYLQNQVDHGINPLDILHGHAKILMLEAQEQLDAALESSADQKYWEGVLDGYSELYRLTYALSFAIADRDHANV